MHQAARAYGARPSSLLGIASTDPAALLVDLTIATLEAVEVDLWKALDEARIWEHHDVAVFCGVQIHGHGGADWIWPRDAWVCGSDGERRPVALDRRQEVRGVHARDAATPL